MLITKIELENITTHKHSYIEFQKGLNVLSGANGTGKSSILNMIGFNLFDYLSGNQKDYLREDQPGRSTYGVIRVWIVGLNDEYYLVERTLGKKNNKIEVSEAKSGRIIPGINNKSSLEAWLKNQISLRQEYNLSDLFKTCIGVPQGTFTEPFLRSPQGRKNFFDPILQIEIYREIWKKLYDVQKLYLKDIQLTKENLARLKGVLLIKKDFIREIENLNEEISSLNKSDKILKDKFNKVNKNFKRLTSLKEMIQDISQKSALLELERENLEKALKNQKQQLDEASSAKEICSKTRKAYERYNSLSNELERLNQKNEELQSLKDNLAILEKELIELEANIENYAKRIKEIESSRKDYQQLKQNFQEYEVIQNNIETQLNLTSLISSYNKQLDAYRTKYTNLSIKIDELETKVKKLENLEKKVKSISTMEEKRKKIAHSIASLNGRLQVIEYNIKISKNNICPFLNEPCKNIGKKELKKIIQNESQGLYPLIKEKEKNLKKIELKLDDLEALKSEYEQYKKEIIELQILKNQKLELGREIKDLVDKVKNMEKSTLKLEELKNQKSELQPKVDDYLVLKEKIEKSLPDLKEKFDKLQKKREPILEKILPIKKKYKNLEDIPNQIRQVSDQMEDFREDYTKYQKNEESAKKYPDLQILVKKSEDSLKETLSKFNEINKQLLEMNSDFDLQEYKDLEAEKKEIHKKLIQIENSIEIKHQTNKELNQKLKNLIEKEEKMDELNQHLESLEYINKFIDVIRTWYKEASPKISEILIKRINNLASDIFRDLMDVTNAQLIWENDYNIKIVTNTTQKDFHQLSGGEQMVAALSVRLAILKILTNIDFAFFDEPTTNLDEEKRVNLARCIQNIKGFKQLFIISHDNTFEENAENVIKFSKNDDDVTQVQFLSK